MVVERDHAEQRAAQPAGHASADHSQQDGGFHRQVAGKESAYRHPHQHAQRERRHDKKHQVHLLLERALFLEEQCFEVAGAHQRAADGGSHAQFHQQGDENETRVHAEGKGSTGRGV